MMNLNLRRLLVVLFTSFTFLPVMLLFATDFLIEILIAISASISAGIAVAYGRGVIFGLRDGSMPAGYLLAMGITVTQIAVTVRLAYQWVVRSTNHVGDWPHIDIIVLSFGAWMFIIGGILHLTASYSIGGSIPRKSWMFIGILVAIGFFFGLMLATIPDSQYL